VVVKRENYITIQGWMVTDLGLKGNNLLVYAIIYGFSQEEGHRFTGSLQYLADWTNSTRRGVLKSLQALINAGLIEKEDTTQNGVKFCSYRSTEPTGGVEQSSPGVNKVHRGIEQSSPVYGTKFTGGVEQSSPNNIDDITNDNSINKYNTPETPAPRTRFVKPTLEEVAAYCKERGNTIDPERFMDYYNGNGWKVGRNPMKDWKATVRNWERNRNTGGRTNERPGPTDYGDPLDFYK